MTNIEPVQIDWKPDKQSQVPIYRQIVQLICAKIASGEWAVGTRLPSQRSLSQSLGVNRSTITTAIDELTSYGIIAGSRGAGTRVISNTWSLMLPTDTSWNHLVSSGFFKQNNQIIQSINRLEFDPSMVRLGTGELDPRLFPTKMWKTILQRLGNNISQLGYLEPLGLLELRQAIVAHMATLGVKTTPANILITSGALQALQLISVSLLQRGSTVITEQPTYIKSLQVFQSEGMELAGVPMDNDGLKYWQMQELMKKSNHKQILYTIPTNQNPSGITMSSQRRSELLKFCVDHQLPIIEDGAYHELCYNQQPATLKSMDDRGMVIYLGSASKTLAPGLRIGWMVAPEPIVQRLGDVKMQMDYGASSVSQWIFREFLTSGLYEQHLDELKTTLKNRRDNALQTLDRYFTDLATWHRPAGGFYIWLTLKKHLHMDQLFKQATENNILLNPGDVYDYHYNHSLRLSFAYTDESEFTTAAIKLAKIIKKLS
ncbi:PLP-dependent aminotransferase family protein [Paucilactobacillus suebicus]|uniref:Multiple substrate aminotransferase n=1 Tax=Paucilactobacillus suebicus DSM 5007 = KCTC 3549 TaxID=1423807 RepID=A0A0R1VVH8_9LACO|nr:PLP-dependent aminotransferase family protein [Paucilactobacillus suebicus]KRM09437.1 multiple substrate aminotransferase [Paucilactobacillus suebicus DSM 5007 = KCTC 3549]